MKREFRALKTEPYRHQILEIFAQNPSLAYLETNVRRYTSDDMNKTMTTKFEVFTEPWNVDNEAVYEKSNNLADFWALGGSWSMDKYLSELSKRGDL